MKACMSVWQQKFRSKETKKTCCHQVCRCAGISSPRETVCRMRTVFVGRAHWPRCSSCSWRPSTQHLQGTAHKEQGHLAPGRRDRHTSGSKSRHQHTYFSRSTKVRTQKLSWVVSNLNNKEDKHQHTSVRSQSLISCLSEWDYFNHRWSSSGEKLTDTFIYLWHNN